MGRLMTRPRWGLPARSRAAHAREAALAEVRARTGWVRATWADVPDALRHAYAALDERDERIAELAEETAGLAHELVGHATNKAGMPYRRYRRATTPTRLPEIPG